jgi:dihydrodipicolinate synthase/N-acetylneuraminate lyase
MMKKLYGVITAMTTPFDEEGKVDVDAIEQQTEFLTEKSPLLTLKYFKSTDISA